MQVGVHRNIAIFRLSALYTIARHTLEVTLSIHFQFLHFPKPKRGPEEDLSYWARAIEVHRGRNKAFLRKFAVVPSIKVVRNTADDVIPGFPVFLLGNTG